MKAVDMRNHFIGLADWVDPDQTVDRIILGDPEAEAFQQLKANTEQAMLELGADTDVQLQVVSDPKRFAEFGVVPEQTPVAVTARYSVKSAGKVVIPEVVKEWLKEIT